MLVKDRMSKHPLTIAEEESISEAHRYMQEQKVQHLPVLNKAGDMVGIVTDDDLLKAGPSAVTSLSMWEIHTLLDRVKVKSVMVHDVITTTEDATIEEAAGVMLDHKIGCLPVMRQGKLVGIITKNGLLRVFMELFATRQKGVRITMEVLDRAGELAKVAQAVAEQGGYVSASGAYLSEHPTMAAMIIKVSNVKRQPLVDALSKIEGAVLTDIREM